MYRVHNNGRFNFQSKSIVRQCLRFCALALIFPLLTAASRLDFGHFFLAAPPTHTLQLGPVEIVRGPDYYTDNSFNTLPSNNRLRAYIANATTLVYDGGSLETLRQAASPAIQAGTDFDSCGAWLNSAYQDGAVTRAWYHAETACAYPQTHKSVGYAESSDGGLTFVKPNYPANQVITAPSGYTNPDHDDEGDQHVIVVGNYFYMYFMPTRDWQVRLARAPISSGGTPGAWQKYANGSFGPPGLGGESSPLDPSGALTKSWVSWNRYTQSYQGFSFIDRNGTFAGFGLTFSPDGVTNWTSNPYLVLSSEGDFGPRTSASKELADYPSLISLYGESDQIGQTFWLYYMYINPGEGFDRRYLLRRKANFSYTTSGAAADRVPKIALSQYNKADDTWFTTTAVDPSYQMVGTIGYLFTDSIPGSQAVYDCYIAGSNDHMLTLDDPTCAGASYLRRVGWISTAPFTNSVAVYRCWDAAATNHFLSTDPGCEGKVTEWRMGYVAQLPVLPQNEYNALSDYYHMSNEDNWVTTAMPPVAYSFISRLGYLFTAPRSNAVAVYDCYNDVWTDHMLVLGDPTCEGAQSLGLIGWISTVDFPNARPIYRCFDAAATNHFVALDPSCEGKVFEGQIGYLTVRPEAAPTVTPTATGPGTATPTPLATRTPKGTATQPPSTPATRTPSPTATRMPTATSGVGDLIFADGFESGNLTAWSSSSTDGGDLSVSPAAALAGSYGLRAVVDDNLSISVTDERPAGERRYRARVYFDPNSIGMASGDTHVFFYGYSLSGAPMAVLRLELRHFTSSYQVRAGLLNNSKAWSDTPWIALSDAAHFIEWDWRAASAAGANNGGLTLWLDGVQRSNLSGVDNDIRPIDRAQLGAVAGIDTNTRGTYYFDAFESRRLSYIGP
jgi:hypothetical protein